MMTKRMPYRIFPPADGGLYQKNQKIKSVHASGDRDSEKLLKYKGRNVHTSGGGAGTQDDAQGDSDSKAGEYRAQENVFRQNQVSEKALAQLQGRGIEEGAGERGGGEGLAEDAEAHGQHENVKDKDKAGYRYAGPMVYGQGNAGGAAGYQIGGKKKQLNGQGIEKISQNNGRQGNAGPGSKNF